MQNVSVNDSAITWRPVGYTVAGCWMVFALMCLAGKQLCLFLNPLPLLIKGIAGIVVYGYVGGTRGWDLEIVFVYWTMIGLILSWCFHKSKRSPRVIMTIIAIAAGLHLVLSALAFIPAMLLAGR